MASQITAIKVFTVLYTHQKTKKAKVWQDGILKTSGGQQAALYSDKGQQLDSVYLKTGLVGPGDELESDRYLITVEEVADNTCSAQSTTENQVQNFNREAVKPIGLWPPAGLKRKFTGFQVPREITKKPSLEREETASLQLAHGHSPQAPQLYTTSPLFAVPYGKQADKEEHLNCSSDHTIVTSTNPDVRKNIFPSNNSASPRSTIATENVDRTVQGEKPKQNPRSTAEILALLNTRPSQQGPVADPLPAPVSTTCSNEVQKTCKLSRERSPVKKDPVKSRWDVYLEKPVASSTVQIDRDGFVVPPVPNKRLRISHPNCQMDNKAKQGIPRELDKKIDTVESKPLSDSQISETGLTSTQPLMPETLTDDANTLIPDVENNNGLEVTFNLMDSFDFTELDEAYSMESAQDSTETHANEKQHLLPEKNLEKHSNSEHEKNGSLHENITDCDLSTVSELSCDKARGEPTKQTLLNGQCNMAQPGDSDNKAEVKIEASGIQTVGKGSFSNKANEGHIPSRQVMFQSVDLAKQKVFPKYLDDSFSTLRGSSPYVFPNAKMPHVDGSNEDCTLYKQFPSGSCSSLLKSLTEPRNALESLNVLRTRARTPTTTKNTDQDDQSYLKGVETQVFRRFSQSLLPQQLAREVYQASPLSNARPPVSPLFTTSHNSSPASSYMPHRQVEFQGYKVRGSVSSENVVRRPDPKPHCSTSSGRSLYTKSTSRIISSATRVLGGITPVKSPTQNPFEKERNFFLRPRQGDMTEKSSSLRRDCSASLEQDYFLDSTHITKVQSTVTKQLTAVSVPEDEMNDIPKSLKPSTLFLRNARSVMSSEIQSSKWTVYQSNPGSSHNVNKEDSEFCPQSVFRRQNETDIDASSHLGSLKDRHGYPKVNDNGSGGQILTKILNPSDHFRPLIGKRSFQLQETVDEPILLTCQLGFPCSKTVLSSSVPRRNINIPVLFNSPAHYKQVFNACLAEHLNIIMYELSQRLHKAFSKVDMSFYYSSDDETQRKPNAAPLCLHKQQTKLVMVRKEGSNKGRFFYACDAPQNSQCNFFKWLDEVKETHTQRDNHESRVVIADMKSLSSYARCQSIKLYEESHLIIRKTSYFPNRQYGKFTKYASMDREYGGELKTKLYLKLSRKDSSSAYSKDDLWVVSKTLNFDPQDTFVACSVFFGPSANNDIEISPLNGYSPSNWPSNMVVHALLVCNASSELTSLRNIQEHFNPSSLPIMPHLLTLCPGSLASEKTKIPRGKFKAPATTSKGSSKCNITDYTFVKNLVRDMIKRFCLNDDQATALMKVAHMMVSSDEFQGPQAAPITIIHGVFGAGKSCLLAVVVLFLVQLFETYNPPEEHGSVHWKLLISSSTNVAVDRVLLGLLHVGFDQFIRVGSLRKIAKPILPHSLHAGSENESEQLKELQALLKEDLTPGEKAYVRKSIELHKLGTNKMLLGQVRVVGATCAACPFPCLNNLKFPVVILDECSQMTEPTSLLPIARFQCEKLILVGDPKQLSPTIQGSEAAHEFGLEQTLFNRLCLMGHQAVMLRTQYRCHPSISAIANELFYEGNLLNGVSHEDRRPLLSWLPTLCFYNANGTEQVEWNNSFYNVEEGNFTVKLIQSLIASGIQGSKIGVITLYRSQMNMICYMLSSAAVCDPSEIKAVQVSTVDAFQGAEKDVIILSCVRTRQVGFIDSEKRMNVALTRGKRHLLIVGSLACLRKNQLWEQVIHHCERHKGGLNNVKQWDERLNAILLHYQEKKKEEEASCSHRKPMK
ncbi:LOW QUALITY PROTEIN: 5'-3' DNA helicase ZGRF1 [Leptodactylus fuscus]